MLPSLAVAASRIFSSVVVVPVAATYAVIHRRRACGLQTGLLEVPVDDPDDVTDELASHVFTGSRVAT